MSMPPQPPITSGLRFEDPLVRRLVALAGTPEDASDVDAHLTAIVRLVVDIVAPADYASVTAYRHGGYTTVAASADVALAVDRAQYADETGPCLDAIETGRPTAVPEVATTMAWPGFRAAAEQMGLHGSLSVPLFAGRGTDVAALNLYSRDVSAMAPLSARVRAVYDPYGTAGQDQPLLDAGSERFVAGLAAAFAVRATIQQAIGAMMARGKLDEDRAYLMLRVRAAEENVPLVEIARTVLAEYRG